MTKSSMPSNTNPSRTNEFLYSVDEYSFINGVRAQPMVNNTPMYVNPATVSFHSGSLNSLPPVQRGMASSRRCRFSLTGGVSFTALLPRKCMHSPHGREIKRFPTSTNKGNPQSQRPMLMPTSKVKPTAAITVNKLKLKNISENSAPNNKLPFCKSSQPSVFRRIQELTSIVRSPVTTG